MSKMIRKIATFVVTFLLVVVPTVTSWAATLFNLRTGNYNDNARLVLNTEGLPRYAAKITGNKLVLDFHAKIKNKEFAQAKDGFIKSAVLEPRGSSKSRLTVTFAKAVPQYKVFTLKNPTRLVFDFKRPQPSKQIIKVAEGVTYTGWTDKVGTATVRAYLLTIAPNKDYLVKPILGQNQRIHKGVLSQMVQRSGALAGINASYFDSEVWVIGNLKLDGKWLSTEETPRTALVVDDKGQAAIVSDLAYAGQVIAPDGTTSRITGMNRERLTNDLIYYNNAYDVTTETNAHGVEVWIDKDRVLKKAATGKMEIPSSGFVLSGHGTQAEFLNKLQLGDRVTLQQSLQNALADAAPQVIGAGPLLVYDGRVAVHSAKEEIAADISNGRAPRTAVGIKKDGTMMFLVVDGRSANSTGLTLTELAVLLIRQGANTAMNFDGGGSSEMTIGGQVMNTPSDGDERVIRVGLGVFRR